jgi:hypothetical protein
VAADFSTIEVSTLAVRGPAPRAVASNITEVVAPELPRRVCESLLVQLAELRRLYTCRETSLGMQQPGTSDGFPQWSQDFAVVDKAAARLWEQLRPAVTAQSGRKESKQLMTLAESVVWRRFMFWYKSPKDGTITSQAQPDAPSQSPNEPERRDYDVAMRRLVYLALVGCVFIVLFALGLKLPNSVQSAATALMAAGSALVTGGLLGFLFGVIVIDILREENWALKRCGCALGQATTRLYPHAVRLAGHGSDCRAVPQIFGFRRRHDQPAGYVTTHEYFACSAPKAVSPTTLSNPLVVSFFQSRNLVRFTKNWVESRSGRLIFWSNCARHKSGHDPSNSGKA